MKHSIYLDDIRTPIDKKWIVVRNYDEFISKVQELGIENISAISLDHDLGESAMMEYYTNVSPNYQLDYSHIHERTGYDCAKWLVDHFYNRLNTDSEFSKISTFPFPQVVVHSANPIGSANMMGYINNFLMNERRPQTCARVRIEHTIETQVD